MRRYALRAVRVALVHDFLLDVRGAERVFLAMCDLWPEADVFTAVYDEQGTEGRFAHRRVGTTFLQRLRPTARSFRPLLPLYPYAIESLDLSAYDLVVSSSSAWAHGVLVDAGAVHVSYCHNPFRYAWNERVATLAARAPGVRAALRVLLSRWRQWDRLAAQHVDRYVANSHTTRRRIERYWGRTGAVVYPPGGGWGRLGGPPGGGVPPAGRDGAVPPGPRLRPRGLPPRAGRAHAAQADRRRRRGLQQARPPARRRRRRARHAPPAPPRRP